VVEGEKTTKSRGEARIMGFDEEKKSCIRKRKGKTYEEKLIGGRGKWPIGKQ